MLTLDRMELGDCFTPEELVDEIYRQCTDLSPPIPIDDIARAAGIIAIEGIDTEDVEGMLVSDDGKDKGVIFYRQSSPPGRQRFTIGHELGHFLLLHHGARQSCIASDIKTSSSAASDQDLEAEANRFAHLLLMPDRLIEASLGDHKPSIDLLREISCLFNMSFEAIANKCASLSRQPFALVYSRNNTVRYCWRDWYKFTHRIPLKGGDALPFGSQAASVNGGEDTVSDCELVDASVWLSDDRNGELPKEVCEQTFTQRNGFQVTMISLVD